MSSGRASPPDAVLDELPWNVLREIPQTSGDIDAIKTGW
jgi:hypothetical protein